MTARRVDAIVKVVVADTCAVWNVLSATTLYRRCVALGFDFALTNFGLYECLHKRRKRQTEADATLQERLRAARAKGHFRSHSLSVEDLQEVEILENRQRLSMGEIAAIAFAKRVGIGFQTDDQGARKLATTALDEGRVQTTPHVVGWLFYEGHLVDSDLAEIMAEHVSMRRPLSSYFRSMYEEAMRCRLMRDCQ